MFPGMIIIMGNMVDLKEHPAELAECAVDLMPGAKLLPSSFIDTALHYGVISIYAEIQDRI
jgi:hypothetical protein